MLLVLSVGVFAGFIDSAVGGGGLLRLPVLLSAGLPPHVAMEPINSPLRLLLRLPASSTYRAESFRERQELWAGH